MANLELEVNLSKEDRDRLDLLISGLAQLVKCSYRALSEASAAGTPFTAEPAPAPTATETTPVATETAPVATETAPAPAYTLEEVRAKVMALSRKGSEIKAKVKEALNKYAKTVPDLHPDHYAAFMADLEAIECPF